MKKVLLTSVVLLLVGASASFATMPAVELDTTIATLTHDEFLQLASSDDNDSGRDDDGDDNHDSDGDDHGGGHHSDSDDDHGSKASRGGNSIDDSTKSRSNRRKPRIPGGSGCDDAGDVAEHPECRP